MYCLELFVKQLYLVFSSTPSTCITIFGVACRRVLSTRSCSCLAVGIMSARSSKNVMEVFAEKKRKYEEDKHVQEAVSAAANAEQPLDMFLTDMADLEVVSPQEPFAEAFSFDFSDDGVAQAAELSLTSSDTQLVDGINAITGEFYLVGGSMQPDGWGYPVYKRSTQAETPCYLQLLPEDFPVGDDQTLRAGWYFSSSPIAVKMPLGVEGDAILYGFAHVNRREPAAMPPAADFIFFEDWKQIERHQWRKDEAGNYGFSIQMLSRVVSDRLEDMQATLVPWVEDLKTQGIAIPEEVARVLNMEIAEEVGEENATEAADVKGKGAEGGKQQQQRKGPAKGCSFLDFLFLHFLFFVFPFFIFLFCYYLY